MGPGVSKTSIYITGSGYSEDENEQEGGIGGGMEHVLDRKAPV